MVGGICRINHKRLSLFYERDIFDFSAISLILSQSKGAIMQIIIMCFLRITSRLRVKIWRC